MFFAHFVLFILQ